MPKLLSTIMALVGGVIGLIIYRLTSCKDGTSP